MLNSFARMLNPLLGTICAAGYAGYYWLLDQPLSATNVMFKSGPAVLEVWLDVVGHASLNMSFHDVFGFLGRYARLLAS